MVSKIYAYPEDMGRASLEQLPHKVLIGGCFDLLHYGHLKFIQSSKRCGNHLVIALESDESIYHMKGALPIHTQQQRAEILASLSCVDAVLLLPFLRGFQDYMTLVERVNPAILAVTKGDSQTENKEIQARAIGSRVVIVNQLIEGLSSSIIRSKLMD